MKILIVRHGIAEEQSHGAEQGGKSRQRPLTEGGKKKMHQAARGLARLLSRPDVIVSSPLMRAVQTAEILSDEFDAGKCVTTAALSPGHRPMELLTWLKAHREKSKARTQKTKDQGRADSAGDNEEPLIAVVGHEPDLGIFASWVLTGLQDSFIELKKGAACLIEFRDGVGAGRATLVWSLKPRQLRRIGK